MALVDYYLLTKAAHVGLVMLSGSVFLARGLGVLMGSSLPLTRPVRITSMVIDSALLTAAILLLFTLQLNPFAMPWLQAKLGLLLAYIFFGVMTLRLASTPARRTMAFVAALLCYVMMFSIARLHDPVGLLRWFFQ